jgi:hypothetical protein
MRGNEMEWISVMDDAIKLLRDSIYKKEATLPLLKNDKDRIAMQKRIDEQSVELDKIIKLKGH